MEIKKHEDEQVYIKVKEGKIHKTKVIIDAQLIIDLDKDGELLGVEII